MHLTSNLLLIQTLPRLLVSVITLGTMAMYALEGNFQASLSFIWSLKCCERFKLVRMFHPLKAILRNKKTARLETQREVLLLSETCFQKKKKKTEKEEKVSTLVG